LNKKILITGPPGCGKSTLVSKIIDYYKEKNFVLFGFLTPEVRESNNRIGFDIIDIYSGKNYRLARVGDFNTEYKLGRYHVFIKEFDDYLRENLNLEGKEVNLIVIDEIGRMELFSINFHNFVKKIFSLEMPILATIGLKLKHPIKDYLQNLPNVKILNLTRLNFQVIFKEVLSLFD
jgi:nucleoside-triphosphatase